MPFPLYSGEAAVAYARQTPPDLILMGVVMPGMNGIEAAIQIRTFLPECRILLFSGSPDFADLLEQARKRGHVFEIASKPLPPQEWLAILRV